MSREIKFRVWNNKKKEWVHGPGEEVNLFGEVILLGVFLKGIKLEDLNDCEACQFTGILDKQDKEIYEGDIVSFENMPHSSIIHKSPYVVEFKNGYYPIIANALVQNIEVIGNIFENPDLLK